MPSGSTYEKALETLDNMRQIVKNEQLKRGEYVSQEKDDELAAQGAICGGHKACLLGTTWLGYGIKPIIQMGHYYGPEVELPGIEDEETRAIFLKRRPALKLVYETLNELADAKLPEKKRGEFRDNEWDEEKNRYIYSQRRFASQAEEFFEVTLKNKPQRVVRKEILALIQQAKRKIRRDARREGFLGI